MSLHPHKLSGFSELGYLDGVEKGAFTNRPLGNSVKVTDFELERAHPCLVCSEDQAQQGQVLGHKRSKSMAHSVTGPVPEPPEKK